MDMCEALTVANIKVAIFWDVKPCSLVEGGGVWVSLYLPGAPLKKAQKPCTDVEHILRSLLYEPV